MNMNGITSVLSVEHIAAQCVPYDDLIPFSKPLGMAFRAFLVAHLLLKNMERTHIIMNNKLELAVGAVINITAGDRDWVKKGAQIVLAIKVIFRIIEVQKRILKAYGELMQALRGAWTAPTAFLKAKGAQDASNLEIEPHLISMLASLPEPVLDLVLRIEGTFAKTAQLLYEVFFDLSRQVFELYEAIVFDRITEFENITGIGVNCSEILSRLTLEPRELLSQITENEKMVDKLLFAIGTKYTAQDVRTLIEKADPLCKQAKKVAKTVLQTGTEVAMTVSFIATASAVMPPMNVSGKPKQPHREIGSFDDDNYCAYPPRKARRWDLSGRYYTSD